MAQQITDRLTDLADVIAAAEPEAGDNLMADLRPRTVRRRVPQPCSAHQSPPTDIASADISGSSSCPLP